MTSWQVTFNGTEYYLPIQLSHKISQVLHWLMKRYTFSSQQTVGVRSKQGISWAGLHRRWSTGLILNEMSGFHWTWCRCSGSALAWWMQSARPNDAEFKRSSPMWRVWLWLRPGHHGLGRAWGTCKLGQLGRCQPGMFSSFTGCLITFFVRQFFTFLLIPTVCHQIVHLMIKSVQ